MGAFASERQVYLVEPEDATLSAVVVAAIESLTAVEGYFDPGKSVGQVLDLVAAVAYWRKGFQQELAATMQMDLKVAWQVWGRLEASNHLDLKLALREES